jgi:hypothetical protein
MVPFSLLVNASNNIKQRVVVIFMRMLEERQVHEKSRKLKFRVPKRVPKRSNIMFLKVFFFYSSQPSSSLNCESSIEMYISFRFFCFLNKPLNSLCLELPFNLGQPVTSKYANSGRCQSLKSLHTSNNSISQN